MSDMLALAERVWRGEVQYHPFRGAGTQCEVADGVAFVHGFSNVSGDRHRRRSRARRHGHGAPRGRHARSGPATSTPRPLHTAVFTHGHIDHVFGVDRYEADNAAAGAPRRRVRRARGGAGRGSTATRATAGYNGIDQPAPVLAPIDGVADRLPLPRRDVPRPARPRRRRSPARAAPRPRRDRRPHVGVGARRNACSAPATSSSGRRRTAATRRRCSATRRSGPPRCARWRRSAPRCCCPGTGCRSSAPTASARRSTRPRSSSRSSHDETLAMMNAGARLDEIVHTVACPGAPARAPVPATRLRRARVRRAQRLAALRRLVRRQPGAPEARARRGRRRRGRGARRRGRRRWPRGPARSPTAGDLRLAAQLAEWAAAAAPDDAAVLETLRAESTRARVEAESSTMAKGIFRWAAAQRRSGEHIMKLEGSTVLVTGASSGIGAALAPMLAARGATVGIVARRRERLEEVLERCAAHAPDVSPVGRRPRRSRRGRARRPRGVGRVRRRSTASSTTRRSRSARRSRA